MLYENNYTNNKNQIKIIFWKSIYEKMIWFSKGTS